MPAKLALAAALILALPRIAAYAQSVPVYQMGTALQNDLAKFQRNGEIRNPGGIAGDNNGIGVNPFSITDYKQLGLCSNSAPTSGPYSAICLGHNTAGDGVLSVNSYGGETNHKLIIELNGTPITIPGVAEGADCANILSYGAVPDDATDTIPAWNAAKAVSSCIVFPAGTFRFASGMTYLFTADTKSLRIFGQGSDVTVLHFPTAVSEGINIKLNGFGGSVHVRDLAMTTGTTNVDRGIYIEQTKTWSSVISAGYARSDVTGVTFRSDEGYDQQGAGTPATITHSWAYGINAVNLSMLDIDGVIFAGPTVPAGTGYATSAGPGGVGLSIEGTSPTITPVEYQITRTHITNCRAGIIVGAYTQGFQMSHLNIVGCYRGIVAPSTSIGDIAGLTLVDSHINSVYGIDSAISLAALNIGHNHFIVPTAGFAINLNATNRQTIINGNTFLGVVNVSPFSGTGIQVTPGTADVVSPVITSNSLWRLATGIHLGANVSQATVDDNFYANDINITNDSVSPNNMIKGLRVAGVMPAAVVTGAVNNGSGKVRVTVASTTGWVNGMMALAGNIGGVFANNSLVTNVAVVDATHLDLTSMLFSGTYTSGGFVTALP